MHSNYCSSVSNFIQLMQSMEVADFAYNVPWYDESLEFQRMILFIILRSQKPLVLRSASISELSFASFAKVKIYCIFIIKIDIFI